MGVHEHRKSAPASVGVGILSVSSTRSLADDESGLWIARQAEKEGHVVRFHQVVTDDVSAIRESTLKAIREHELQALLITGGTGITPKDVTIDAIKPLFVKEMTAFGAIFAQLSYEEIDAAAILSRAAAGIIGQTVVFCMPGSKKACQLACKALIFPDLGHVVAHAR
ncbi:molybdenum cofactor biosynthesis protein B [Desulfosarcina ovata subsp. sediminis]|uniref:Molybdenum cofactor biosynthesis protein B n=1 Tax=Desulfosarcina ovata subsp. sediminis TaxID=885957 RepID=A0A5K7ZUX5_9BACT|nr:molybdenum cofactor synthesis domain-containing protein [Desulfosarcina ovata]BBO84029.1 molybdenum cofactor biosynthesis protein B [Desulfosarcina ovata subsp. sediminis]